MSEERAYVVEGMSCGHCRTAVVDEVGKVDGVGAVDVNLESGRLTVCGTGFTDGAVHEAVREAGYGVRAA